jgi:hypothetical protein
MTSGGARGADTFFAQGIEVPGRDLIDEGLFKLYLPFLGFQGHRKGTLITNEDLLDAARQLLIDKGVYKTVPRFMSLKGSERSVLTKRERDIAQYHTRNAFQIVHETLVDPVDMVICWTPDGAISRAEYKMGVTGGTGIGICLAEALGIEVFNLRREDHLARICKFIGMEPPTIPKQLTGETNQISLI